MGAVFKARDNQAPDRPWVAVKVAQLKGSAAVRQMLEDAFRREGQAAGMLSQHVKYFVGFRGSDFSDPAYLVLDFVEWPTLGVMRKQLGVLSPVDVAALGVEIVRGVRFMERRRMVHRDLKPDNIFARRTGDGFEAKIADLGVWVDSGEAYETSLFGTAETRLAGTPAYMSPEQLRSEALTSASDLHMVASILWEVATGHVPYPFRTAATLAEALRDRHERMRTVPDRPPGMPDSLYRILASGLQFDPAIRGCIDAASGGSSDAGPARRLEKALDDFVAGYADAQRKSRDEAREYTRRARDGLAVIEPILDRARALITRAETLRCRVEQIATGTLESDPLLEESMSVSTDVQQLLQAAQAVFDDRNPRTLVLPLADNHEELGSQVKVQELLGPPTAGATHSSVAAAGSRRRSLAMLSVAGALGMISGALAMHTTNSSPVGSVVAEGIRATIADTASLTPPIPTMRDSALPSAIPSSFVAVPEPPSPTSAPTLPSAAGRSEPTTDARSSTAPKTPAARVAPRCGNGLCEVNEGMGSCCYDCCPSDGVCNPGENSSSADCRAVSRGAKSMGMPPKGTFTGLLP